MPDPDGWSVEFPRKANRALEPTGCVMWFQCGCSKSGSRWRGRERMSSDVLSIKGNSENGQIRL